MLTYGHSCISSLFCCQFNANVVYVLLVESLFNEEDSPLAVFSLEKWQGVFVVVNASGPHTNYTCL